MDSSLILSLVPVTVSGPSEIINSLSYLIISPSVSFLHFQTGSFFFLVDKVYCVLGLVMRTLV